MLVMGLDLGQNHNLSKLRRQTPGEIVDANFGQDPFKFDIEGEMMEHRSKVGRQIEGFPTPGRHGDWQCLLHQMVSSYLVHHGFRFASQCDRPSIMLQN